MKILLVEDNIIIGFDISHQLVKLGCEVLGPLATAEQALKVIRELRLDGALLDYSIRGGTSEPIAEALRSIKCPFAFMTGHVILPASADGALRLEKPVMASALAAIVNGFRSDCRSRGAVESPKSINQGMPESSAAAQSDNESPSGSGKVGR